MNFNSDKNFNAIIDDKKLVFITSQFHVQSTDWLNKIYCLEKPNSFDPYISMYIRKENTEKLKINEIIRQLIESGLIKYWQSSVYRHNMGPAKPNEIVALTLNDMTSGFVILFTGYFAALAVFTFECVINRKINSNSLSEIERKFWILASKAIDCKRYAFINHNYY